MLIVGASLGIPSIAAASHGASSRAATSTSVLCAGTNDISVGNSTPYKITTTSSVCTTSVTGKYTNGSYLEPMIINFAGTATKGKITGALTSAQFNGKLTGTMTAPFTGKIVGRIAIGVDYSDAGWTFYIIISLS
jgi:hypothetical protein